MSGLPIVFVPGLLCTGRIYEHQVQHLGQKHPVLLANHWSHPSMSAIAKSILEVAPDRFALVGTSMGGYVAFEIARQAPQRVAKLVLLSTSAKPDTPERSEGRRKLVATVREHGVRKAVETLWPNLVHPARHEDLPLLAVFNEMADQLGPDAFARQIEAIIGREDSRPGLAKINIPVLVVASADDKLITPDNSREIAAGIPGARLEVVELCGHMGMLERPATYAQLLVDFLD